MDSQKGYVRIMHLLRSCSPIAIFVAATLSSGAVAQAKPPVELTYEVYFGGFHIMSARAELSSGETDYNLQVESVSRGIADFFVSWKGQAKSNGLFAGDKAVPAIHRNDGVWKGKTRKVDIRYAPSGEVTSYSVEPEPDLEKVNSLPENPATGTVDPLSVIAQISGAVMRGEGCSSQFGVFDGRRRYDLTVTENGTESIKPNSYSVYAGDALACGVEMKLLGGDRKEKSKYAETARNRTVYIARPRSDAPPVPVRVRIDTDYGILMAHLTGYTLNGETVGARGLDD